MNNSYSIGEPETGSSGNKSRSWIYLIAILLLAVVAGLYIAKYIRTGKEVQSLTAEKENLRMNLQGELDSLLIEHEKIKQEYGELSDVLIVKDSVIQANALEIKQLLDTQWEYYKVKKKLDNLRDVSQSYLRQIDSLFTVNRALKEENLAIRQTFEAEQKKTESLQKDKEELTQKITEAAVLRAYNISAVGVRFKSAEEEKVTDKARRVDKIKICFTLAANQLIAPGQKDVYMRIARPDNMILTKGKGEEFSFTYMGAMLQYSILETVDYNTEAVESCTYWIHRDSYEPLTEGNYVVSVYTEDKEIGQTSFVLQ
jgi:cell division protein FtsB